MAGHLGPIGLVDRAGRKQATQLAVDQWGEGQQQQARGVAIEPVHQAQLRPAPLDPGDEGIGQIRPQTGLAQEPGGLVKGRQPGIAIHKAGFQIHGANPGGRGDGKLERRNLQGPQP